MFGATSGSEILIAGIFAREDFGLGVEGVMKSETIIVVLYRM